MGRTDVAVRAATCILAAAVLAVRAAGDSPINEMCPVMTAEKADASIATIYRGKTIAFCCEKCLKKFTADPERYAARLPQLGEVEQSASGDERPAVRSGGETRLAGEEMRREAPAQPFFARLHPAIVHFPVAGVPLAFLGFVLYRLTGRSALSAADAVPLLVSAVASVFAVVTGNMSAGSQRFSAAVHSLVEWHERAGTALMIALLVLCVIRLWRGNRLRGAWAWFYGSLLLTACVLAASAGFLGGSLVFGPEHLRW